MGLWLLRIAFIASLTTAAYLTTPFYMRALSAAFFGVVLAVVVILLEINIRRCSLKTLAGGLIGTGVGLFAALLVSLILRSLSIFSANTAGFLQIVTLLVLVYTGMAVGATRGSLIKFGFSNSSDPVTEQRFAKLLDTSVIIDGRIGDLVDTGFLEGEILVPEFVLRELQLIADSEDQTRRNRGRRGLDILQRLQKKAGIQVQIIEQDYPEIKQVDLKLIEMARELPAKIVTNDLNLNKVAQLRGVKVLNINELANAMKAVVLPGESMQVFIIKEGKEYNQGVAYLDDGTMVVIDNARRMIGRTVEIQVTSVLQTTAGKMIFGKFQSAAEADKEGELDRQRVSRL